MISITFERKIDTVGMTKKLLENPNLSAKISAESIRFLNLDKRSRTPCIKEISELGIKEVSNFEEKLKNGDKPRKIKENGRTTYISSNLKETKGRGLKRPINSREVWLVDFGQPVGNEFGYPHPAVVYKKSSTNNCIIVFPCSSQEKYGKTYNIKFSEENLKSADPTFLSKAVDINGSVLLDQRIPVDRVRFLKYYGTLDEEVFKDILREAGESEEDMKRNITIKNLELTEKQEQILEKTNRTTDILAVANNAAFTYEQRVRAILSIFGFKLQLDTDVTYLEDLIKNTRYKNQIDIISECEELSKHGIINARAINTKLIELVKKQLRLHPVLTEFVLLVNELAS